MRWILWILGSFALAVAVALALRFNAGYALLVWPPYRIELSLNLLLLFAVVTFAVLYLLFRFIFSAMALPAKVREFRERRTRENARVKLLDAMHAYFEGRYVRAERAAASAMESGESPALGAVLAARAAHELRRYQQRDAYLERAARLAPDDASMRLVSQADMLLAQRQYQEALTKLKELPDRHTSAVRLELKAQQLSKNWDQALPLIDQLEKRGAFDADQAEQLRRYAHVENLKRKATDKDDFEACWDKVPARLKRDSKIAGAAAQCFIALGGCAHANQIIEQALEETWESGLVRLYADCETSDTIRQIERAEAWLTRNPRDAALLLVLGRLCARQGLWGKAQNYFEASLAVEPSYSSHLELARLCEGLENMEAARRHYRASLEMAVEQIHTISGGRRRAPL